MGMVAGLQSAHVSLPLVAQLAWSRAQADRYGHEFPHCQLNLLHALLTVDYWRLLLFQICALVDWQARSYCNHCFVSNE